MLSLPLLTMHEPLELTARNKCDAATRGFCLTLLPNLMPHHCGSLEGLGISTSSVMFGQCAALCLYKCAPIAYQKECIYMMFIDILIYIYIYTYAYVCVRVSVRASESVSVRPCVCTVTRHARAYLRK